MFSLTVNLWQKWQTPLCWLINSSYIASAADKVPKKFKIERKCNNKTRFYI